MGIRAGRLGSEFASFTAASVGRDPVSEREKQGSRRIERILTEAERLQSVLDNFLQFAAGRRLQKQPTDVNRLLDELAQFLSPQAEKARIRFVRELAPDLPRVPADPNLLRQAAMNILLNAQQAMPAGGTITLRTRKQNGNVHLQFADTGEGIPEEVRHRVFDIYFSTKPAGTGLGLPITRRIVEEHDGSISIQSAPGRGTLVTVVLPYD